MSWREDKHVEKKQSGWQMGSCVRQAGDKRRVYLDSSRVEVGRDYLPKIILLNQGKASSFPCLSFLQLVPLVSLQI